MLLSYARSVARNRPRNLRGLQRENWLVVPASNVIPPDFTRMAPAGVSIQTARVSETGGAIWSPDLKSELAFMKNALSD